MEVSSRGGRRRNASLFVLLALTFTAVVCQRGGAHDSLLGTWELDAETQEWLPRACVVLNYATPGTASFEIDTVGDEHRALLGDERGTIIHGTVHNGVFVGRQLLPTTTTGRFCGSDTIVRLRLDQRGSEPDTLSGLWQTPYCDICPDRHFGAIRKTD